MSRVASAQALIHLGFDPRVDFKCVKESPTSTRIVWYSQTAQPSEAIINAVTDNQIAAVSTNIPTLSQVIERLNAVIDAGNFVVTKVRT